MIEALATMAPYLRRRLANALESELLAPLYTSASVRSTVGIRSSRVVEALQEWERIGGSGAVAAAWLGSLDETESAVVPASLVWTGPEAEGVHSRDTRQVYQELISTARESLLVSTFAYFDGPRAFKGIADRMKACPALRVSLLLNIHDEARSTTKASDLVKRFVAQFWQHDWPGSAHPTVYYFPNSLELAGPTGVLHAKSLVKAGEDVFITSANAWFFGRLHSKRQSEKERCLPHPAPSRGALQRVPLWHDAAHHAHLTASDNRCSARDAIRSPPHSGLLCCLSRLDV